MLKWCPWLFSGFLGLFIYIFIRIYYRLVLDHKSSTNVTMNDPREIGDWQQLSVLGTGAFGTVTLWCNRKKNDFVAIKKCKFQKYSSLSPKQRERWIMEVDFMKSINHPNVIAYKKLDPILEETMNKYNPSKLPLLSMEYCQKGNLRRFLSNEPIKLCGLQEHDVRYILEDISNGLDYLHSKHITHRDIKPENIVLQHWDGRRGETLYKIIDLGYAKELQDSTLSFVGTLQYLAPEIFANGDYDHTVDYWSMGIMIFEIICGVLPFLPELNPFERYQKIQNKSSDDICIYSSYSGATANSSELRKEHFVSSCFKQNIERWLRKVLQLDPSKRVFNNNISAFDHLRYILDRKIVKVFSVHKLEHYSYEINDGTLLGTLKDWISRDIKVPKSDLLLLFRSDKPHVENSEQKQNVRFCDNDEALVDDLLHSEDDVVIYVYKKNAVVSDTSNKLRGNVPHLVKELFNPVSNFQLKFAKQLYRQALFYIFNDLQVVDSFRSAYVSLIQHIDTVCDQIKERYISASKKLGLILTNVKEFLEKNKNNGLTCDNNNIDLSANQELIECLKYFERLLSNVERREQNLKDFGKQVRVLRLKQRAIPEAMNVVEEVFSQHDLSDQFRKINGKAFLEKRNGETNEVILTRIREVISETTKLKCNLFIKNKDLKNYSNDFCYLLKSTEQLLLWVDNFIKNVDELLEDFVHMEERHEKILTDALKNSRREFTLSYYQEDSLQLIEENNSLRCEFENLLSKSLLAHKDFVEDSGALLN